MTIEQKPDGTLVRNGLPQAYWNTASVAREIENKARQFAEDMAKVEGQMLQPMQPMEKFTGLSNRIAAWKIDDHIRKQLREYEEMRAKAKAWDALYDKALDWSELGVTPTKMDRLLQESAAKTTP